MPVGARRRCNAVLTLQDTASVILHSLVSFFVEGEYIAAEVGVYSKILTDPEAGPTHQYWLTVTD